MTHVENQHLCLGGSCKMRADRYLADARPRFAPRSGRCQECGVQSALWLAIFTAPDAYGYVELSCAASGPPSSTHSLCRQRLTASRNPCALFEVAAGDVRKTKRQVAVMGLCGFGSARTRRCRSACRAPRPLRHLQVCNAERLPCGGFPLSTSALCQRAVNKASCNGRMRSRLAAT